MKALIIAAVVIKVLPLSTFTCPNASNSFYSLRLGFSDLECIWNTDMRFCVLSCCASNPNLSLLVSMNLSRLRASLAIM